MSLNTNKALVNVLEVLLHVSGMFSKSCSQHLIYYFLHLAAGKPRVTRARVGGGGSSCLATGGVCGFSHFIASFLKRPLQKACSLTHY